MKGDVDRSAARSTTHRLTFEFEAAGCHFGVYWELIDASAHRFGRVATSVG